MGSSSFSFKRASALVVGALFLTIRSTTNGVMLDARGNTCCGGLCGDPPSDDEIAEDMNAVDDGPTADKSAGQGIEYETGQLLFVSPTCNEGDTFKLKGKLVAGRQDKTTPPNWMLTGDSTTGLKGQLQAEYILDGINIKVGANAAGPAAAAVANDIVSCCLSHCSFALCPAVVRRGRGPWFRQRCCEMVFGLKTMSVLSCSRYHHPGTDAAKWYLLFNGAKLLSIFRTTGQAPALCKGHFLESFNRPSQLFLHHRVGISTVY